MCIQHSTVEGGPPDGGGRCDLDPRQEYPLLHLQTTEVLWKEHGTGTKTHVYIHVHCENCLLPFYSNIFVHSIIFSPKMVKPSHGDLAHH